MSAGVGAASMVSGVDAAVAVRVRAGGLSANVNSTDHAAVGGFAPMTTTTVVALACVHDAAAVRESWRSRPLWQCMQKPEMKLVPVAVMGLPT